MAFQSASPVQQEGALVKRGRFKTVGVPVLAAVLSLGLGSAVGASGAQSELTELRETEQSLSDEIDTLEADGKASVRELEELASERDAQIELMNEQEAQIRDLTALNAKLEEKIRDLDEQVLKAREQAAAAAEPKPLPFASPQDAAPDQTSAYFANCTAARDAGAAPVYEGDPGYGRHLDRDGDGVGCE